MVSVASAAAVRVPDELCVTCLCRLGQARSTVLRAVVCGPCWAAHGGSPAAGEIGPEPVETVTSFDPAGQGQWLRALRRQDWVQTARVDARRNVMAVARLVALYAQWDTLESRPTWARLIARSGLSERTVARWLQELRVRGWLAHLEHGSTPNTRPIALAALEGNRAALYGLRIPLTPQEALTQAAEQLAVALARMLDEVPAQAPATPPAACEPAAEQPEPAGVGDKNGSLPYPVKDSLLRRVHGFTRASTTVDNSNRQRATEQTNSGRTALRAGSEQSGRPDLSVMVPVGGYQMLACADWLRHRLPIFARCSRKLVRHLCKPYWRAGWCGRDILHALDHRPSVFSQATGVLLCPEHVISPTQFIRSRLAAWRTPDGAIVPGYWAAKVADAAETKAARQRILERHGHAGAALLRGGETTLSAERIAEHGRNVRPPTRRRERDDRRAALDAETHAPLTRNPANAGLTDPSCPATVAGANPYQRALTRARAERGTAKHALAGRAGLQDGRPS